MNASAQLDVLLRKRPSLEVRTVGPLMRRSLSRHRAVEAVVGIVDRLPSPPAIQKSAGMMSNELSDGMPTYASPQRFGRT